MFEQLNSAPADRPARSSSTTSSRQRLLLGAVGVALLANLVLMGVVLSKLSATQSDIQAKMNQFERYEPAITSMLHGIEGLADASSAVARLFGGSVPVLAANVLNTDWGSLARNVSSFAGSVHGATCSSDLTEVSRIASLVSATTAAYTVLPAPRPAQLPDDNGSQLTGEGGLLLEWMNYWSSFIKDQANPRNIEHAASSCVTLANKLYDVKTSGLYGASCSAQDDQFSYNIDSVLDTTIKYCSALQDLPSAETIRKHELTAQKARWMQKNQ